MEQTPPLTESDYIEFFLGMANQLSFLSDENIKQRATIIQMMNYIRQNNKNWRYLLKEIDYYMFKPNKKYTYD